MHTILPKMLTGRPHIFWKAGYVIVMYIVSTNGAIMEARPVIPSAGLLVFLVQF